ncbi:MAG: hypothetical protein GY811_09485 [Myxococcales bacterium]|nr:hypothetical protein [Myxococcales bacterium]
MPPKAEAGAAVSGAPASLAALPAPFSSATLHRVIHLFYGDAAADAFSCFNKAASKIILREALLSGPAALPSETWNDIRSGFLADAFGVKREECLKDLTAFDEQLEGLREEEDEIVCWFGRDLFCQVGLIYTLVRLGEIRTRNISLVCPLSTDEDIYCFGDVAPAEMNDLLQKRIPIDDLKLQQAAIAWHLYASDDPESLNGVFDGSMDVGPGFALALEQHASRFPWANDGLGVTERAVVLAVKNEPLEFSEVFRAVSKRARHITWGDMQIYNICQRMVASDPPLLSFTKSDEAAALPSGVFALTEAGESVLEGLGGVIERAHHWLGGCELSGVPQWCWDSEARRIVYAAT